MGPPQCTGRGEHKRPVPCISPCQPGPSRPLTFATEVTNERGERIPTAIARRLWLDAIDAGERIFCTTARLYLGDGHQDCPDGLSRSRWRSRALQMRRQVARGLAALFGFAPAVDAMNRQKITGVILAGGLGRRMGGSDKGLQALRGRPLVAWVVHRFGPQVDELLINAGTGWASTMRPSANVSLLTRFLISRGRWPGCTRRAIRN